MTTVRWSRSPWVINNCEPSWSFWIYDQTSLILEFLTLKNPVENWFTFSLPASTRDKARQISKLGWSLFTVISNVGTPLKYWSSSKELVCKSPTSSRLSIMLLLNFPGLGPKCPPSDGVGLHGSWTIVNHPDPFEFMVRLPSVSYTHLTLPTSQLV